MRQMSMDLVADSPISVEPGSFSHDGVCAETVRIELEHRYAPLIEVTDKFSRRTVSFQANKVSALHSWFKFREGFSAELVELLLQEFSLGPGDSVLDPFAGSCTTLLEAKLLGLDATGVELLPHCHLAWEAKSRAFEYDVAEIAHLRRLIESESPPHTEVPFPHLAITESAFPEETEQALMNYAYWFPTLGMSIDAELLAHSLLMSVLEEVSYTRKDGQYLRWDARADKIVTRNKKRMAENKKLFRGIDKGQLPTVKEMLLSRLETVIDDIAELQNDPPLGFSRQELIRGNTLLELPALPEDSFSAVITSPPYANRYDYTRTYALELAFLNVQEQIFSLRQDLLSCTVENRPKNSDLKKHYESLGLTYRYADIERAVNSNLVLAEVHRALQTRSKRGEINNKGVLRMVNQYFTELAFVFAELYRVSKKGAYVAFVNDNVRYAGEVIPVDTISTSIAEDLGFQAVKIYVIPQRKGNSSQQMKKFGRRELRKSITIWKRPNEDNNGRF